VNTEDVSADRCSRHRACKRAGVSPIARLGDGATGTFEWA
jgi:hypothetical protein